MTLIAATLALASAFNLTCAGTFTANSTSERFESVERIDLEQGLYCNGECKATHKIYEVTPLYITLSNETENDVLLGFSQSKHFIDRETGRYVGTATRISFTHGRKSTLSMFWNGQCVKSAFTGFPKIGIKF